MSWSTCKKCGDKIVWARMPAGNYLPMDPDGGGFHECTPFQRTQYVSTPHPAAAAVTPVPTKTWSFKEERSRKTFPIACWWCHEPVYFHTNGFGDCVLFDRLGWPWQVHECWLKHREQQQRRIREFEQVLKKEGYSGQFREPTGEQMRGPAPGMSRRLVRIQGYVANNHSFYDDAKPLKFGKSGNWFQIQIGDDKGHLYPFLVPEKIAEEIDDYLLLEARGYWIKIDDEWRLLATAFASTDYQDGEAKCWRMASAISKKRCFCCRRPLASLNWSLNEVFRPECVECAKLRGKLTPIEFLKIVKWIGQGWKRSEKT